jgi:hypothetical protein
MVRLLGLSREEPQGQGEQWEPQGLQLPESLFILKIHGSLDVMMKKTARATLVISQAIRRREDR